jgi:flagellar export protein FliJ
MKRFDFRLEPLLRLKEQIKRQAELRQQQARVQVEAARAEVEDLQSQLAEAAGTAMGKPGVAAPAARWIAHLMFVEQIGQALTRAGAKQREAEKQLFEANAQRVRITTEVEALLFLRHRRLRDYKLRVSRAELNQQDDMAMRRWLAALQEKGRPEANRKGNDPS